MKIGDVKNIKAAKKYSNAIIMSAIEENNAEKVYQDLVFIAETISSNRELELFLYNPVVTLADKKDTVIRLFSPHTEKITLDFILLLLENNRLNILNEVINQYLVSLNQHKNIAVPVIISAIELNEEQKARIINKLQAKLSKQIQPEYKVSKSIIGGLVIELDDTTIDCSLKTKFENMKKQLTKGNNYGNN